MLSSRTMILILGPIVIVAVCYWLTMAGADKRLAAAGFSFADPAQSVGVEHLDKQALLRRACRRTASQLAPSLSANCRIVIRPPYVLAGDLSETVLEEHYRETIVPTARALSTCYFDREPDQPITVLMFSAERVYREHAARIDNRHGATYYGYYQKADRRIVLNIATGNGTLAHELAHAMAHFDFPNMPEWFDEGLASLYEQSEFSEDGLRLMGVSNWRIYHLVYAIRRGRLRALKSMITAKTVRDGCEAIDYAHARYFCLYLQERQVLGHFYRKFRATVDQDATGLKTLCQLLQAESLDDVDRDFRRWVIDMYKAHHRRPDDRK